MLNLYIKDTQTLIGRLSEDQLDDLIEILVEESDEDRDYYIDETTLDYLAEHDADPALIAMLRPHVPAGDEGIEIEWREEGP